MGSPSTRETPRHGRALPASPDDAGDRDQPWEGGLHQRVAARMADLARPRVGEACLDIGGGAGIVASALREAVGPSGSVVSVDISERSIEMARSSPGGAAHLMKMSGGDVIFRDHTFDVVVLSRSIAHVSDAHAVIGDASRMLKIGGRMALFCRRRGLATVAEQAFLEELALFVQENPVNLPDHFLGYPGLADRREVASALRAAGLEDVTFGDVVTGGRTDDAAAWNREMMGCWPAARILVGALAGRKRLEFEGRIDRAMGRLGDDAFRYHHPYLLAVASKVQDRPVTAPCPPASIRSRVSAVSSAPA